MAEEIIEFYGETCPHCISMRPVVSELEKEMSIRVQKLEVWNNESNHAVMEKYSDKISEACGGYAAVPSFINTKTGQALCGAHDKTDLKILFEGGDCSGGVCKPHTKMDDGNGTAQK